MKVKVAGYGDIELVAPYEVKSLSEIKIVKTVNNHAMLYAKAIIPEEKRDRYIETASCMDTVQVNQIKDGSVVRTLFNGLVSTIEITVVRDIYYLEVEALSHTYSMDVKPQSRSFQNKDMLYMDVVEQIMQKYPGSDYIDIASKSSKLGTCIIQYQETDWQFLKRIASHFGAVLVSDAASTTPKLWFGLPEGRPGNLVEHQYTVQKALSDYRDVTKNYDDGVEEEDFATYTIETEHHFDIGDFVTYKGSARKVAQSVATIKNGVLTYEYTLASEKGIRQNFITNGQLSGVSLDGTVIDVAKDMVRIHLDIDPEQKKEEAYWFPYATPYAAEGNSGWYCMPQLQDSVQLYLPSSREEEAVAVRSIRQGGKQYAKTANPTVKYWGTNQGKELKMEEKGLVLIAKQNKEGQICIKLREEDGIEIHSEHSIVFTSDKNIEIELDRKLDIRAQDEIYLLCGSSSILMDGFTDIRGSRLQMGGLSKKPVFVPDKKEEKTSEGQSESLDSMQRAVNVAGMIPSMGFCTDTSGLGASLAACVPFAGMAGDTKKKVTSGVIGKVLTGARGIKNNLSQPEAIKKLKSKMKAETMKTKVYVPAPEKKF